MRKSERRRIGGGGLGISSTWGIAGVGVGGVRRRRWGLRESWRRLWWCSQNEMGFRVLDLREGLGHHGPELK